MKEKLKYYWKPIVLLSVVFLLIAYGTYYVNCVLIPTTQTQRYEEAMRRQEAEQAKLEAEKEPEVPYDYSAGFNQPTTQTLTSDAEEQDDTEEDNSTANMASGGSTEDITGGTGVYLGEHPEQNAQSSGTAQTTAPNANTSGSSGGEQSGSNASDSTPQSGGGSNESSTQTTTPTDTSNQNSNSNSNSNSGSDTSKPKDGDRRVVNGQEQEYWEVFDQWVDVGPGSHGEVIEGDGEIGAPCPNASFG